MNQPANSQPPQPNAVASPAIGLAAKPVAKPVAATSPSNTQNMAVLPGAESGQKTILSVLLAQKNITQDQVNQIRQKQMLSNKSFEEIIKEGNVVSEEELVTAKAEVHGVPFVKISETGISPEALNLVDESVARRYHILPFSVDHETNQLFVAMENPLDLTAIDFAEKKSGLHLVTHFAMPSELERMVAERYSQTLSSEVTEALEDSTHNAGTLRSKKQNPEVSGGILRDAPINRIVETVLEFAVKARASDIHIEPQAGKTRVRYRIDGILMEKLILPKTVHEAVISRIKILSDLKIDEKRIPQDGRFNYKDDTHEVDLRVSTMPSIYGEKVVMRLLKKNTTIPSLEDLGMSGLALKNVKDAAMVPHGIILITGPTGSGKTTTLYSLLHIINTPKVNIMTLEDPVEYQITGITQVQVNPQAGLTFSSGLRSFLRQDPDIIMVGEIRDTETAELAIQASLTGHLVFSTLHTSSAAGALPRLLDMGAEPFLLSSSITLSMAQRVVRRINESYKEEYKPEQAVIDDIKTVLGDKYESWCKQNNKDPNQMVLYRPKEDRPPNEPDYKGRVAIYEVMKVNEEISRLIMERKSAADLEKVALQNGMLLMKQDGYIKVLEGMTTIEEVLRVAEV